jgi:hypothetical protein
MRSGRPEERIHRSVVHYLRTVLPPSWLIHHSPNGGWRSKTEAGVFKALGVIPGWPDISIFGEEAKGCQAWFLEVKSSDGRLTDVQRDCHNRLRELGFPVAVVHSIDEARVCGLQWGWRMRDIGAVA